MLTNNLLLMEEVERQHRDRLQKEAETARRLNKLVVKETLYEGKRDKKLVLYLGWMNQARA